MLLQLAAAPGALLPKHIVKAAWADAARTTVFSSRSLPSHAQRCCAAQSSRLYVLLRLALVPGTSTHRNLEQCWYG